MKKKLVEIRGAGFVNKGAEMMVQATINGINKINSDIEFALDWDYSNTYWRKSKEYGFYLILQDKIKGLPTSKILSIIPFSIRKKFGIVLSSDIDALIDISGFKYTSQFPFEPFKKECDRFEKLHRSEKKIILMPQAFGPFNDDKYIHLVKKMVKNTDLIYARDNVSLKNLTEIVNDKKIQLKPDFTSILIRESKLENKKLEFNNNRVCLIPNARMLDKTDYSYGDYINLFKNAVQCLRKNDLVPYFLIHAGKEDRDLADRTNIEFDEKIQIIEEDNPNNIKNIISESKFLIASRFHSIASALYLNVPVIGTGWSHKYNELFNNFNQSELLITDITNHNIEEKIMFISKNYDEIKMVLSEKNIKHDLLVDELFKEVVAKLTK